MKNHSERQREILRKIGVNVWKLRDADTLATAEAAETVATVATITESPDLPDADVGSHAAGSQPASPNPPPVAADASPNQFPDESPNESLTESLDAVKKEVSACRQCELHRNRTHTVFGCGSADADWLLVGDAPGQNEDLQGQPFVGRAGQLLDQMIAALGMKREQVFIANVLKCRPPDDRDPLPQEIEQCEPYLHRQLALIQPKVIVALGETISQVLLKSSEPLGKLRGKEHQYGRDNIPLVATYHPADLLQSPAQKAAAWDDLWRAKMRVDEAK